MVASQPVALGTCLQAVPSEDQKRIAWLARCCQLLQTSRTSGIVNEK